MIWSVAFISAAAILMAVLSTNILSTSTINLDAFKLDLNNYSVNLNKLTNPNVGKLSFVKCKEKREYWECVTQPNSVFPIPHTFHKFHTKISPVEKLTTQH